MSDFPFSKYVALATPYVFGVSVLYLYGFWSTFDLNIFEFIKISDVINLTIYNIVTFSASFLLGHLLSIPVLNVLPPGGGVETPIGRFGNRHWKLLIGIDLLIIFIIIYLLKSPDKWLFIIPFSAPLSIILTHLDFFIDLIPNPTARLITLGFLAILPMTSFAGAKSNSYNIIEGKSKYIVDLHNSNIGISGDNSVAYIGLAGDYFILYGTQTRRIFIIKNKDKEVIVLAPNAKP